MRSQNTKWAKLLQDKRNSIVSAGLLTDRFGRRRIIGRLIDRTTQKLRKPKMKRYAIPSLIAAVFIMVSVPIGLYLKVSASYSEISNEDWSTVPAENIDGLVTSVGGELTLDPRSVADDWCDTDSCNSSLPYRKLIDINYSGEPVENARIYIYVENNEHMKADFSDIRFVSKDKKSGGSYIKGSDLRYSQVPSVAEWTWVNIEIPNLIAGSQQIYMYYGNQNFNYYINFAKLSPELGFHESCAIDTDGKAYCWGKNVYGQLGNGNNTESRVPVAVDTSGVLGGLLVKNISNNDKSTCVIAGNANNNTDDKVYCWGYNFYGQLGNGNNTDSNVPVAVDTFGVLSGLITKQISGSCVIAGNANNNTDDKVYCWGYNFYGQLGNGNNTDSNVPVAVDTSGVLNNLVVKQISAGGSHTCAIAGNAINNTDDKVYCWGYNYYGQLGNDNNTGSNVPVAVDTSGVLNNLVVKQISANVSHTCAIAGNAINNTADRAYCWGYGLGGQLGDGSNTNIAIAVAVDTSGVLDSLVVKQISAGGSHTCAIAGNAINNTADRAYCWGNGYQTGALGVYPGLFESSPPILVGTSGMLEGLVIKQVSAGLMHACAIDLAGKGYCWGNNSNGQAGTGLSVNGASPTLAIEGENRLPQTGYISNPDISFNSEQNINDPISKTGSLISTTMDTIDKPLFGNLSITSSGSGMIQIKVRTDSDSGMANADDWTTCNLLSTGADIYSSSCVNYGDKYLQYQIFMTDDTPVDLKITKIAFPFQVDATAPATNATDIEVRTNSTVGSRIIKNQDGNGNGFGNSNSPYATWSAGTDDVGGVGIGGYCLYLGPDSTPDLLNDSGELPAASSPVDTHGLCKFAVAGTSYDLSNSINQLSQTTGTIYFAVQAFDKLMNIYPSATTISYAVDINSPNADTELVGPSVPQESKAVTINWDVDLNNDIGFWDEPGESGVVGVKYCIVNLDGDLDSCSDPNENWFGPALEAGGLKNLDDIFDAGSGQLITSLDHTYINMNGNSRIYVAAIDRAGNSSTPLMATARILPDATAPATNATDIEVRTSSTVGSRIIKNQDGDGNGFSNSIPPYASWSAATDDVGGVGIEGYCLYLGPDSTPDLMNDSGELPAASSPVDTHGLCKFAVAGTSYDLSNTINQLSQTTGTIYFAIQAFDKLMNIYPSSDKVPYTIDNHAPHAETTLTGPELQKSKAATITWIFDMAHFVGFWDEAGESGVVGVKYCIVDLAGDPDNCNDPNTNWYGPALQTGGLDNQTDVFDESTGSLTTSLSHPTINENGVNRISIVAIDKAGNISTPVSTNFTLSPDPTAPITNATNIAIKTSSAVGARVIKDSNGNGNGLANGTAPYITWTAATDDAEGSGIKGYCLALGTANSLSFQDNYFGTSSPINTGGKCAYAVSTTYFQVPSSRSSGNWKFSIKAIDQMNNLYPTATTVSYDVDNDPPEFNTALSGPSGVISTKSITINWLQIPGQFGIMDRKSGVAGLKYCIVNVFTEINNCDNNNDNWFGPAGATGGLNNMSDLFPVDTGQLITRENDPNISNEGIFIVGITAIDNVGNYSEPTSIVVTISDSPATAPTNLTVTPASSAANNFSFTWQAPEFYLGTANDIDYCWTVNEEIAEDASNCRWTEKGQLSLPAGPYATKQNDNVLYLMARSQAGVYDNKSFASAVFDTSTPAPGPPSKLGLTDVSIRDFDNPDNTIWRIAMSWAKPTVSLDLVHNYQIWRSTDGVNFGTEPVGSTSTTNLSFIDVMPTQEMYYYKVVACDNADSCGMPTNIASKYPTGHFTEPAKLTPGSIEVRDISTRRATINWLTELESDSLVIYDTKTGLNPDKLTEVGDSKTQTKIHSVTLTNLQPGTKYYYQARWTNIDDFVGTSGELSFTTLPAPVISEVNTNKISISGGTINFTVDNASKMNIYYGKTEAFGGVQTINTSTTKSTYSIALSDLDDGTKYYFKLNGFDVDGNEYQGFVFSFTTLPRPRISNLKFQPVVGASSNTTKVSWITNVPASSELTYGPVGGTKTETLNTKLVTEHEVTITGLEDDKDYTLVARSRDGSGNLAVSETQAFRTALDTRPPKISNVIVESSIKGSGAEARGQVVISWTTDEPATSQVAYGQGAPGSYSNKTSEDSRLSSEHIVIISDLATSSIFQVQPLSKDKAANEAKGANQSAIISRGTEDVFTIIFNSLRKIFGIK